MTKTKPNTKPLVDMLIDAKIAELDIFNNTPYVQVQKARNACYSATNSLQYKQKLVSDQAATLDTTAENATSRIAVLEHEKATKLYESMLVELEAYQLDLDASLRVYTMVTGKPYQHPSKK